MGEDSRLPLDAEGVLRRAEQAMFDAFARSAMGMMVVDRDHRVLWISEGYKRFLPALGFEGEAQFVGRKVEEVVPNSLMAQVIDSGQAILVDLLSNRAGTFLVSRLPLRDAAGQVIGAVGLVLLDHPETTMQPLIAKFGRLQRELEDAHRQLAAQRRPKYSVASFIGSSPAALEVKRQARRVAATDSTVLLQGETGTGKELLAQGIHAASSRAARAFVGVNIAAVPETLLEADFFGVAPGAYTGADRKGREGKFLLAHGGTLFLDEIGDMPLAVQAKLLRALQEQEVEPLGSNEVIKVDVRVIAATSRDLGAMVAEGRFREDLYYRLAVVPIRIPPLRERLDDFEALAEALLDDIERRTGLPHRQLAPEAIERLAALPWRGNIRELRNVLERACMMTDDLRLTPAHFGALLTTEPAAPARIHVEHGMPAKPGIEPVVPATAGIEPVMPAKAGIEPVMPAKAEPVMPAKAGIQEVAGAPSDEKTLGPGVRRDDSVTPLPEAIAALERNAIRAALAATGGNRMAAAKLLKISRAALYDKLALYPEITAARD